MLASNSAEETKNIVGLQKVADSSLEVNVTEVDDVTQGGKSTRHDEAFEILASTQGVRYVTEDENARILKKIDWHIMPVIVVIYFLQLLDKQTLAFSSVFGLSIDARLVGDQYSLLGSMVYVAQLVLQPLSAYFLVKLRLPIYVPIIVTCWGATLAIMASATNFQGLLVARFFLGIFEASITPAVVLVVQMWYRLREQGYRMAAWCSCYGFVNVFGSLVMFGLGHVRSNVLYPYQVVFLLLGIVTFLVGLISFFLFPDNPVKSDFLSPEEKLVAVERLRANQQGVETKVFKMYQVWEMILDPKSWCWMILALLNAIPAAGMIIFGPLILRGFGFDRFNVMLVNIPFGVLQILWVFLAVWASERFNVKSIIILIGLIPSIVGTVLLLQTGRQPGDQPTLLVAFYLLSFTTAIGPVLYSWQASNVAGHTKKTTTVTFMTVGGLIGDIIGPLLFAPKDKPYYRGGLTAMLICLIVAVCFVFVVIVYLHYSNKRNERRRVVAGKKAKIQDYSMLTMREVQVARAKEVGEKGGVSNIQNIGTHAFDDLTDLQNNEFIYVY